MWDSVLIVLTLELPLLICKSWFLKLSSMIKPKICFSIAIIDNFKKRVSRIKCFQLITYLLYESNFQFHDSLPPSRPIFMGTNAKPCVLNSTYVTSEYLHLSFFIYFFFLPHEWRFDVMFVEDEVLIMLCTPFWKQMERKPNVCIALQDNRVSMRWKR